MGHWAMMVSLSVATVDAGGKRLGPMSVPSGSRNLISNCSWAADISGDGAPETPDAAGSREHTPVTVNAATDNKGRRGTEEPIGSLPESRRRPGESVRLAPRWNLGQVRFLGPGDGSDRRSRAARADHRSRNRRGRERQSRGRREGGEERSGDSGEGGELRGAVAGQKKGEGGRVSSGPWPTAPPPRSRMESRPKGRGLYSSALASAWLPRQDRGFVAGWVRETGEQRGTGRQGGTSRPEHTDGFGCLHILFLNSY